jgi:hypothetical protein
MKDGCTLGFSIDDFDTWRRSVGIRFTTGADTLDTGEISTKRRHDEIITTHKGKWETFDVIVKSIGNTSTGHHRHYVKLRGSLHKNHFGGTNFLPFTWQHLQQQIDHICKSMFIEPQRVKISRLEIGLNVSPPFPVMPLMQYNVIDYKGKYFNWYNKDAAGVSLGKVCDCTQYAVKIYDKGLQNKLPNHLMRFELRYLKMQQLNRRGIKFLSDLQDRRKVEPLGKLLFDAWHEVLIYDIESDTDELKITTVERKLLSEGQRSTYWQKYKVRNGADAYKYQRNKFKLLVKKHGNNWHQLIRELIEKEWNDLLRISPNLPSGETVHFPEFTIKINGKNGETTLTDNKRYCLSCGKELHQEQKPGSKFCSSKFVGEKSAHQCRNNDSNPRNNTNRKLMILNSRGLLFDIMPYFVTLH